MTARRALRWLTGALLAVASFVSVARAEQGKVRFLVEQPTSFSNRLRAEIEAMGFAIVPARAADESAAAVVAEVRVVEAPAVRRVEVWIASGDEGRLALGSVVQPSPDDDDDLQSVRASEQLRALFQPLRESPPPPAASAAPPEIPALPEADAPPLAPAAPPVPPARTRRFVGVASIAGSLGPGLAWIDALIQGRWLVTPAMGVGGSLYLPIMGSTIHSGVNEANLRSYILDAELSFRLSAAQALQVTGVAGLGVAWVVTKGDATAPYTSLSDDAVVALPLLGIEVAPGLAEHVRLCLGARLGFALPGAQIVFADQNVALWGRPLTLVSVGVSVEL